MKKNILKLFTKLLNYLFTYLINIFFNFFDDKIIFETYQIFIHCS